MPIPGPNKNEDKDIFLERCMSNSVMVDEYTDEQQRYAICLTQWEEKDKKSIFTNTEKRSFDFNIEDVDKKEQRLIGHAAVFNEYTSIGWFQERVLPGAFLDTIRDDDVMALFNHNPNYVLGRKKAGTLTLQEDERGLAIDITPPNTQFARDLVTLIGRGDINKMSITFQTIEDAWDIDKRDLIRLKLFDVSPVTYPAYPTTDVAVRSFRNWNDLHKSPALSWKTGLMRKRLALNLRGGKKYE